MIDALDIIREWIEEKGYAYIPGATYGNATVMREWCDQRIELIIHNAKIQLLKYTGNGKNTWLLTTEIYDLEVLDKIEQVLGHAFTCCKDDPYHGW